MNNQGAAGGHITQPQHTRNDSQAEPAPADRLAEKRGTTSTEAVDPIQHPRSGSDVRRAATSSVTSSPCEDTMAHNVGIAQPDRAPMTTPDPIYQLSYPSTHPLEPPVTKATLSELDVTKIVHNPKLRHDINFDPELHFRPNLDGEKGRRKQERANQFWNILQDQLLLFVADRETFMREQPKDWCLPIMLKAVKDILRTLVPQRDRDVIDEGFNVDLLMQQFHRGIADLEKVASWLSGVLKLHCAPMRDAWVDEMYSELSNGNRNNDMAELVKGMRSLLNVLEAMKLDAANHRVRCLRPMLIEDTVHFEQRFFYKKIQGHRFDISSARAWYNDAVTSFSGSTPQLRVLGEMAPFFEALAKLLLPTTPKESIPNTFLFDEERLVKLRSDILDVINLEICMRLYEDLERVSRVQSVTLTCTAPKIAPAYMVDDDASVHSNRNSTDFGFMNTPSSRRSSLALSACSSADSSPRSSGYVVLQPPPSADSLESFAAKASTVYDSLVTLLNIATHNLPPTQRWPGLVPAMATQILRYTNAPLDFLPLFETRLAQHLTDMTSDLYQAVEAHFHARMMNELGRRVRQLKDLSAVALFSVATGGRVAGTGAVPASLAAAVAPSHPTATTSWDESSCELSGVELGAEAREEGAVEDMATRLAHLGLLHWRVWSGMAYLGHNMDSMDLD